MIGVPDGVLDSSLHSDERIQHFGAAALQKKLDSLAGLGNVELGIALNAGELVAMFGGTLSRTLSQFLFSNVALWREAD